MCQSSVSVLICDPEETGFTLQTEKESLSNKDTKRLESFLSCSHNPLQKTIPSRELVRSRVEKESRSCRLFLLSSALRRGEAP